jgi:Tfp pilus tip-associated adhesin PilY1
MALNPQQRRSLAAAVIRRDGSICVWCSMSLTRKSLTVDHVLPVSAGGSNWRGNLLAACLTCNGTRGSRPVGEWAEICRAQGHAVQEQALAAALERVKDPRATAEGAMLAHGMTISEAQEILQTRTARERRARLKFVRGRSRAIARGLRFELADPPELLI